MSKAKKLIEQVLSEGIGETILHQIRSQDRMAMAAWGAKNIAVNNSASGIMGYPGKFSGYLQFDVRGSKFRGRIIIGLTSADLYTVIAGTIRGADWKIKKVVEGVYFDSLIQVIDGIVG